MRKSLWVTFVVGCISISAFAYAPTYNVIISRVADNHGRGGFIVDQDVTYHVDGADNQVVHETWTILDENHMKVSFQGTGALKEVIKGTFVYDTHNRTASEPGAGVKTRKVGEDWAEPYFTFKYSKAMRNKLVQAKFLPSDSLRDPQPMKSDAPPVYTPEPFVKLVRQNGMVAWALSKFENEDSPTLWIEQDQFVVTKVRLPSKSEIEAEDFGKFEGGLNYPRQRNYRWNNKNVTVQVKTVRSIGSTKPKEFASTASLVPFQFGGSDVLKEFYLRFR